eukprot:1723719-Pleurochrysis_carterae.AAC.1
MISDRIPLAQCPRNMVHNRTFTVSSAYDCQNIDSIDYTATTLAFGKWYYDCRKGYIHSDLRRCICTTVMRTGT